MRFAVGYQFMGEDKEPFASIVEDYRGNISEVYFALPGHASGRSPVCEPAANDFQASAAAMLDELKAISETGIPLTLLMNAACYGDEAISAAFADRIRGMLDGICGRLHITAVTTTSPFVAGIVKAHAGGLETRASVNMRIGSVAGMEYLAYCFDGYYLKREHNRDLAQIELMKHWCDEHGKKLYLLANSGCLRECSAQTFHDNLVAHETGVKGLPSQPRKFPVPCWDFLSKKENSHRFLCNSWIRPENVHHYERWFTDVKLATRCNPSPRMVIDAYVRGKFRGNLLDILEPNYSSLYPQSVLDNTLIPDDWFDRVCACDKNCHRCGYCAEIWNRAFVSVEQEKFFHH